MTNDPASAAARIGAEMARRASAYLGQFTAAYGEAVAEAIKSPYPPWHPRLESMAEFVKRANLSDAGLVLTRCQLTHGRLGRCADCPPMCDCPMDPYHRWNCPLTPIWAQTIRELDCNPWGTLEAVDTILAWGFPTMCPICNFNTGRECVPAYNDPICTWCWQLNRHREPELWHCADCGEFVSDGKRMQVVEAGAVVIVCPEHFAGRAEAEA